MPSLEQVKALLGQAKQELVVTFPAVTVFE